MIVAFHLRSLELQLLDPRTRRKPAALTALLTPDFREFGASGRIFTRESVLHLLQTETDFTPPEITNFEARELAPNLVLVTYQTIRPDASGQPTPTSNRSSLWTLRDHRWQLLFHQGTRIP